MTNTDLHFDQLRRSLRRWKLSARVAWIFAAMLGLALLISVIVVVGVFVYSKKPVRSLQNQLKMADFISDEALREAQRANLRTKKAMEKQNLLSEELERERTQQRRIKAKYEQEIRHCKILIVELKKKLKNRN